MIIDEDLLRRIEISLEAMTEYAEAHAEEYGKSSGRYARMEKVIKADAARARKVLRDIDLLWQGELA